MQNISFTHYRTAPKYKVITILKYHMIIFALHSRCALYRIMWLFSIEPSHPYDFTLKNFPGLLLFIGIAEN